MTTITLDTHAQTETHSPALVCVDWGSTNFRCFLLDKKGKLLDSVGAKKGVLSLAPHHFETTLLEHISLWLSDAELPIIMSGMVGSQKGWSETQYLYCPFDIHSLATHLHWVEHSSTLKIAIVPGIKGHSIAKQPDVMRGEEVQILGAFTLIEQNSTTFKPSIKNDKCLMCLPGTHSKWANIDINDKHNAQMLNFSTQMTGEIYSLLTEHSILGQHHQGVSEQKESPLISDAFIQGVNGSQNSGGLLHHLFSARTHLLEGVLTSDDVDNYLSGLLLGAEVDAMLNAQPDIQEVVLVGNENLNTRYQYVLNNKGINTCLINGKQAAYTGMLTVAKQVGLVPE